MLTFCISETLALATIGMKLLDEVVGLATRVLFVIGVLCNSTTEAVTRGMANVPGCDCTRVLNVLASLVFRLSLKILLVPEGVTDVAVRLSVCTTLLVCETMTLLTVSDDEISAVLIKCVDVDEGIIWLLFADAPTNPVEDVSKSVELTTWLCNLLTLVVIATVCVNVTEGNPECMLDALAMSSVIFGVVELGETAL